MSQHSWFPCSCGQKVRIASSQAGEQIACACGKTLSVPTLRAMKELAPAPPIVADKQALTWSRLHGASFAAGLALATIGVALIALFFWRYVQIQAGGLSTDRSNDIVQWESSTIDKMTAVQMLDAWSELVEQGLGEKQTPIWVAAKEQLQAYRYWIAVGACSLIGGIGLSVATLFVGRQARANP
jgi:hypothetical protein